MARRGLRTIGIAYKGVDNQSMLRSSKSKKK
jgi:hypothetical protein